MIYLKEMCKSNSVNLENVLICSSRIQVKSDALWWSFTTGWRLSHTNLLFPNGAQRGTRRMLGPPSHRMIGAERSFVTVGRSFTVAKGFSPLQGRKKCWQKYSKTGIWSENSQWLPLLRNIHFYKFQAFPEHYQVLLWDGSLHATCYKH